MGVTPVQVAKLVIPPPRPTIVPCLDGPAGRGVALAIDARICGLLAPRIIATRQTWWQTGGDGWRTRFGGCSITS